MVLFVGGVVVDGGGSGFLRQSPHTAQGVLELLILLSLEHWEDRHIPHTQFRCWFWVDNPGSFCKHAAQAGQSTVNTYLHNQGHTRGCACTTTCLHNLSRLLYSTQNKPWQRNKTSASAHSGCLVDPRCPSRPVWVQQFPDPRSCPPWSSSWCSGF